MTPDYSDNDIEDEALLGLINRHERSAANWRGDAATLRKMAVRYHECSGAACTPADERMRYTDLGHNAEGKASVKSSRERECLAGLNGVLLASSRVGDIWEVNDSLYRVVTIGNPCVRLGCTLPKDEPDTDPDWSDRDEQAARMRDYAELVRVGRP